MCCLIAFPAASTAIDISLTCFGAHPSIPPGPLNIQLRPGHMTREQLVQTAFLMLVAGNATVATQINLGVISLLQHPDQVRACVAGVGRLGADGVAMGRCCQLNIQGEDLTGEWEWGGPTPTCLRRRKSTVTSLATQPTPDRPIHKASSTLLSHFSLNAVG